MKFSKKSIGIITIVAVSVAVCGIYLLIHAGEESTDDAQIDAHIVTISTKVGGFVKTLNMKDNQMVNAGDVLLEIDPTDYIIRRDHAIAALAAARAGHTASSRTLDTTMISAPSNLDAAQAQVNAAEANWAKANSDLKRLQGLSKEARSTEQLDAAIAAEKTALSNLEDAKAKLRSAETAPKVIASAKSNTEAQAAQVKQAEADLAQAESDLANTKVIAQQSGHITNRSVEQGDYVQPGQMFGSIVNNNLWVVANFKETQLSHMHPGDKVDIHIDAFPKLKLSGKVDSIQTGTGSRFSAFPPENATGNFVKIVQRVPVKILFDSEPDPALPIGVGMSVVPTVYTK